MYIIGCKNVKITHTQSDLSFCLGDISVIKYNVRSVILIIIIMALHIDAGLQELLIVFGESVNCCFHWHLVVRISQQSHYKNDVFYPRKLSISSSKFSFVFLL